MNGTSTGGSAADLGGCVSAGKGGETSVCPMQSALFPSGAAGSVHHGGAGAPSFCALHLS
jgi:hypothetical protein